MEQVDGSGWCYSGVATDAFAFQLRQLLEQISFIEDQIEELDLKIAAYMEQTDSFITTIPGIGPVLGAVILSEVGDISRFEDGKKLVAYAGIDAAVSQSGNFEGSQISPVWDIGVSIFANASSVSKSSSLASGSPNNWFKSAILPDEWIHYEIKTIRRKFYHLAANICDHGRYRHIRYACDQAIEHLITTIIDRLRRFKPILAA